MQAANVDLAQLAPERLHLAAYLGYEPARELLGSGAPPVFALKSMLLGGDRTWRKSMRLLGHEPAAFSAVEIAKAAFAAFVRMPEQQRDVVELARDAVDAFVAWKRAGYGSSMEFVEKRGGTCYLALEVGGQFWRQSSFAAHQLGRIVGHCYSVILGGKNPRHVRWLGEAAEATCKHFEVPELEMCALVRWEMMPYALRMS